MGDQVYADQAYEKVCTLPSNCGFYYYYYYSTHFVCLERVSSTWTPSERREVQCPPLTSSITSATITVRYTSLLRHYYVGLTSLRRCTARLGTMRLLLVCSLTFLPWWCMNYVAVSFIECRYSYVWFVVGTITIFVMTGVLKKNKQKKERKLTFYFFSRGSRPNDDEPKTNDYWVGIAARMAFWEYQRQLWDENVRVLWGLWFYFIIVICNFWFVVARCQWLCHLSSHRPRQYWRLPPSVL